MKRKSLLLLAFLMMLYIVPVFFMPTSYSSTIPTEQNMTKDFSVSSGAWYNEAWNYRKSVIINAGEFGTPTYYQVQIPVTYDSDMQADFDDIRFTDLDGVTLLDFWLESKTDSTSAVFWVEVIDNLGFFVDVTIYMYYGNDVVSSASNGTATFLMYEDWASESVRSEVWDIVTPDGSVSYNAAGASHGTIAKFEANNGAFAYKITSDYDTASPIAVMFRSNIEITGAGNSARQGSGYDGAFAFNLVQSVIGTQTFYVYDDDGNQDSQAMDNAYFDNWITYQITRNGTNSKLYADTVLIETASCSPDIITTNPAASIMVGDAEDYLYSDWVAVRKFVDEEPAFDSFGEEEEYTPPSWQEVGEAEFIFSVLIDQTALNWFLIFLGMFMVPASTLYLVKGGKDNMSMDKVFYFIVAFLFGWGLIFIGVS